MSNLAIATDLSHKYPTNAEIDARIASCDYELLIDNYCGGGGASEGMEQAMGRPVDIGVNHDKQAIAMHKVNHPYTRHYNTNVWDVDPIKATFGKPVGAAWFSPDCKHFSRAKGGKPVDKNIRGLAWVVLKWAALVRPRIILLENVVEFKTWGRLTRSNRPSKPHKGETFKKWLKQLEDLGYKCEFREKKCSAWGVPTDRTRLFMIARCDGEPIVWPMDTHGKGVGLKKPRGTGNNVIDWSIPCPSIFGRKKPLVENTMRRIARGVDKFVINNADPFILRIGQTGWGGDRLVYPLDRPLTTITSKTEHCLVVPSISQYFGQSIGSDCNDPLSAITLKNKSALVSTFLAKHFGGNYTGAGTDMHDPLSTVTGIDHNAIVASWIVKYRGDNIGSSMHDPLQVISAGGNHHGEVCAFLLKYFGAKSSDNGHDIKNPIGALTGKSRYGLVMVYGELYQIVDIGMRMLQPHELYKAHDFPFYYTFTHDIKGNKFTKTKQTAMVGNSVPPEMSRRIVTANYSKIRNYSITPIKPFIRGQVV